MHGNKDFLPLANQASTLKFYSPIGSVTHPYFCCINLFFKSSPKLLIFLKENYPKMKKFSWFGMFLETFLEVLHILEKFS